MIGGQHPQKAQVRGFKAAVFYSVCAELAVVKGEGVLRDRLVYREFVEIFKMRP